MVYIHSLTIAKLITKVKEAESLGVIIDKHLSRSNHIGELRKKISSAIGALTSHTSLSALPSKSIKR